MASSQVGRESPGTHTRMIPLPMQLDNIQLLSQNTAIRNDEKIDDIHAKERKVEVSVHIAERVGEWSPAANELR